MEDTTTSSSGMPHHHTQGLHHRLSCLFGLTRRVESVTVSSSRPSCSSSTATVAASPASVAVTSLEIMPSPEPLQQRAAHRGKKIPDSQPNAYSTPGHESQGSGLTVPGVER